MNYRMIVQYDGTRYEGWQRQTRTEETIQGRLEKAVLTAAGEAVQVIGAGRTDAGVHAKGQVANVRLKTPWDAQNLMKQINEALPDDIAVVALEEAHERFHSRFSAREKTYRYRIRTSAEKNVFERRFVWQYGRALDVRAMKKAAAFLTGTHDFASFCANRKQKAPTVRTLSSIHFREEGGELAVDFTGDGFLQGMVRILMGTLVEVGEGKRAPEDMARILEARSRQTAGFTAPPQGLCLMRVIYGDESKDRKP